MNNTIMITIINPRILNMFTKSRKRLDLLSID